MRLPKPVQNVVLAAFILVMITTFFMMLLGRNYDAFAQCLSQKGVKVYCSTAVPECGQQAGKFGKSAQYLTRIDCTKESLACSGITYFPTWQFSDGGQVVGIQELSQLSRLSDCKI